MLHLVIPEKTRYGTDTSLAAKLVAKFREEYGEQTGLYRRVAAGFGTWDNFDDIDEFRPNDTVAISDEVGEAEVQRVTAECRKDRIPVFVITTEPKQYADADMVVVIPTQ